MVRAELVGILNITPDSFSDGGQNSSVELALAHARKLQQDGAAFIYVGAESTRPGAVPLTDDEEWARLEPVLGTLINEFDGQISLDTYHPQTVRRAMTFGKFIINDVTAFTDPHMIELAAESGMKCIVSHMPERFGADIQLAHKLKPIDSVGQVRDELLHRRDQMIARGVAKGNIIVDPGIGFGKTVQTNWDLLEFASIVPDIDVMAGYSCKKFLGEHHRGLEINLVAGRIAIAAGTKYLRVHDVAGHTTLLADNS